MDGKGRSVRYGYFRDSEGLFAGLVMLLATAMTSPPVQAQTCNANTAHTTPDSRFSAINEGAEVKDNVTHLVWQRCSMGQRWNGKTCLGSAAAYTWAKAQEVASATVTGAKVTATGLVTASAANMSATIAPTSTWRLPTHKELFGLAEQGCRNPAINTVWFPGTRANFYWSASTVSGDDNAVWGVDFSDGSGSYDVKDGSYSVRLVRSEQ